MHYSKRNNKFLRSLARAESFANQEVIQKGFDAANIGLALVSWASGKAKQRFAFDENLDRNPIEIDKTFGLTLFAESLEEVRIDRRHELRDRKELDEVLKNISTMLIA